MGDPDERRLQSSELSRALFACLPSWARKRLAARKQAVGDTNKTKDNMSTTTTTTTTQLAQPSAAPDSVLKSSHGVSISEVRVPSFTQRALLITAGRKYELKSDFETLASLAPGEVKIRSHAVGLNQIDYKSVDYNMCLPELPWITGREMAGVVEEVGSAVQHVKPGQRVWTCK